VRPLGVGFGCIGYLILIEKQLNICSVFDIIEA